MAARTVKATGRYTPNVTDIFWAERANTIQEKTSGFWHRCNKSLKKLGNKPLTSLFDLSKLDPNYMKKQANTEGVLSSTFKQLPIGAQLGIFRLMREKRQIKQAEIDTLMEAWLIKIGKQIR